MAKKQVKIFLGNQEGFVDVEKSVNEWLIDNGNKIKILKVMQSFDNCELVFTIFYESD